MLRTPVTISWDTEHLAQRRWIEKNYPHCVITRRRISIARDIDMARSRDNPARLDRKIQEHVIETMVHMAAQLNPYPLDRPWIWFPGAGELGVVCDGLHRITFAQRVGIDTIECNALTGIGQVAANVITLALNIFTGNGQTESDKHIHAYRVYVESRETGETIREVAARLGFNMNTLKSHIQGYELEDFWVHTLDIKGLKLMHSVYVILAPLRNYFHDVSYAAGKMLVPFSARMTSSHAEKFMKTARANNKRNPALQIARLTITADEIAGMIAQPVARSRKVNIQADLIRASTLLFNMLTKLFGNRRVREVLTEQVYFDQFATRLEQIHTIVEKLLNDIRGA